MQKILFPFFIVVALISLFYIVDRKEFNHYDDIQSIPTETKQTDQHLSTGKDIPTRQGLKEMPPPVVEATTITEVETVETNPKEEVKSDDKESVSDTAPEVGANVISRTITAQHSTAQHQPLCLLSHLKKQES